MLFILLAITAGGMAFALGGSSSSGSNPVSAANVPGPDPMPEETEDDAEDEAAGQDDTGGDEASGVEAPDLPNNAYDIGWAGLSAEEQMIVELVNRARMDPGEEVDRLDEGLASGISSDPAQPLAVIEELSDAARDHSEDMDDRDFFSHLNPDNDGPGARAIDAGYGSGYVGENIGWIGSTFEQDEQVRAEAHHENLWESDGHQRNLMDEDWSEIGVGYDHGDYQGYDESTFVTEMFGDKGETYLTGVVIEDADGDEFYDIGEGQGDVRITAFDGETAYATATWAAGGYTLALPPGTYNVVFEGGELDQPYATEVTIGNENVKLDVIEEGGSVVASLNAGTPLPGVPVVEDTMDYVPFVTEVEEEDLFEMV